eukprot:6409514-Alexandrium_andersonii.AAC.1
MVLGAGVALPHGTRRWGRPSCLPYWSSATSTARGVAPHARGRDCRPLSLGSRSCGGRGGR